MRAGWWWLEAADLLRRPVPLLLLVAFHPKKKNPVQMDNMDVQPDTRKSCLRKPSVSEALKNSPILAPPRKEARLSSPLGLGVPVLLGGAGPRGFSPEL